MTLHTGVSAMSRTAAQVLVDQLRIQGVDHVFCVPGESYLPVLDALYDSGIEVTVCRNEGGASMMAEAYGKATGRPGICFVTRGPGATNGSGGIHIAQQDSTPMILFVGQVETHNRGRDAFQEMDYRAFFGGMAKWVAEVNEPDRMAEHVTRAFATAMAGRPGPVVLSLPHDVLPMAAACADGVRVDPVEPAPAPEQMAALQALLDKAERPMLILGGSRWDEDALAAMARFAERFGIPVATSFRRAHHFDPLHPNYAGDLGLGANPKLVARVKASDLVIVAGARLSEFTAQAYTLFDIPVPQMTFVHAYPGAEDLGRVYRPHLPIPASPRAFAAALDGLTPKRSHDVAADHQLYLDWSEKGTDQPGPVNISQIMIWLRGHLPDDAIITNGAGNYASWIHRFYRFRKFGTQLGTICGFMGYGMPAAVAMKRLYPQRTVVAINGDGDFLMNGQELATAMQYGVPIIAVVLDNSMFGTIRMHQEREYPGRVSATTLVNPDFAAMARSFGGFGANVDKTEDFAPAFEAAQASGLPSVIHVKFDGDGISPTATLSGIRQKALGG
ncbi:MAG: thiamine pyrophosphate-binding protein [Alphaproteobacteria bacterium]|nr:thiamine pyrophosphate-binding protein [Alphaproteobacteria bacterium]